MLSPGVNLSLRFLFLWVTNIQNLIVCSPLVSSAIKLGLRLLRHRSLLFANGPWIWSESSSLEFQHWGKYNKKKPRNSFGLLESATAISPETSIAGQVCCYLHWNRQLVLFPQRQSQMGLNQDWHLHYQCWSWTTLFFFLFRFCFLIFYAIELLKDRILLDRYCSFIVSLICIWPLWWFSWVGERSLNLEVIQSVINFDSCWVC